MYFSRITFNPWVNHQQLAQTLCQDTYREHQALWQLFDSDPDASRDFLYRQVIENGRIKYYVVSERIPIDKTGMWLIAPPKPYAPQLNVGQRLFFTLRANPVITVSSPDGKKQRHDVVMHEKKRIGFDQLPAADKPSFQHLVQSACTEWLEKRAERNGFTIEAGQVAVEAYRQHKSFSKRQNRSVRYSSVDYQGILKVIDPELFTQTLFKGVGKAKAFGCGLLLVKRV